MTSTTLSTRSWYSSERRLAHLLPKSERQQRDRDQHDGSKGEEQASAQAHRYLGSFTPAISNPPSHSAVTPDRPRRTMACSRVSTSGTMVSGSSHRAPSISDLQVAARVERPAVERHDVAGVGSPPPRRGQRLTGQSGGTLVGPPRTVRKEHVEQRRCGRARRADQAHQALGQIARRAVARVVHDPRSGRGLRSRRRKARTSQSGNICHQNGPRAPRASPRTASSRAPAAPPPTAKVTSASARV